MHREVLPATFLKLLDRIAALLDHLDQAPLEYGRVVELAALVDLHLLDRASIRRTTLSRSLSPAFMADFMSSCDSALRDIAEPIWSPRRGAKR